MNPQDELNEKLARIRRYLDARNLHGVFLTRQSNFSWVTGGCENRVTITSEIGAATAFVSRERICVIANNIEAPRLRQEEVGELDVEVLDYPWYQEHVRDKIIRELAGGWGVASDTGFTGTARLERDFDELKYTLTDAEIDRYKWLGRNCSLVIEKVCTDVRQEEAENEVAARLAHEAMKANITPTVILVAADDRTLRFRHPLPTEKKVKEVLMVVFGGRRWGLIASLTRLVHFGKPAPGLLKKHEAACTVDAALILNSRAGATTGHILQKSIDTYQSLGFPNEWQLHHQGGPTGYDGRYYRVTPGDERTIQHNQAVAWNPSIAGAKSEDTILCTSEPAEVLTPCHQWPTTQYEHAGMAISRPDIFVL
ncbi:MAG: M24 family metallopeptidase [Planctomycetes bacterium]|nr:M24 family metallopeptidase [Planctomycetota bacterium]